MTLYPNGYGTQMITLERMRELHEPNMHPEFARRFFRYIESKGGLLGVGGGFRLTQPIREGFAPPGKSFHEAQQFASGIVGYCAVDLVVPVAGRVHRAPTWAECADAPKFMLHTFVSGEPWHIQPIEIRGWQTWVNAGRPDPINPNPSDPNIPPSSGVDMQYLNAPTRIYDTRPFGWLGAGDHQVDSRHPSAEAITVTITVIGTGTPGFATLWGDGPRPNASVINWGSGKDAIANTTTVRVVGGKFRLFVSSNANVIMDVQGVQ